VLLLCGINHIMKFGCLYFSLYMRRQPPPIPFSFSRSTSMMTSLLSTQGSSSGLPAAAMSLMQVHAVGMHKAADLRLTKFKHSRKAALSVSSSRACLSAQYTMAATSGTKAVLLHTPLTISLLEEICMFVLLCAGSQALQQGLYCSWYSCNYLLLQVNATCCLAV